MGVKPRSELLYKWASSARDLSEFQSGPEAGVSARYCIS